MSHIIAGKGTKEVPAVTSGGDTRRPWCKLGGAWVTGFGNGSPFYNALTAHRSPRRMAIMIGVMWNYDSRTTLDLF